MRSVADLSLGWQTHLIFPRFDAEIVAHDDHLLVRTPHSPTFWWGNFVLFDRPPREGDAARWLAAFDAGITRRQPESRHLAIGIDSGDPVILPADFAAAGLCLGANTVLTMRSARLLLSPPPLQPGCRVVALETPEQVTESIDAQVAADGGRFGDDASHRLYFEREMRRFGAMQRAGLGQWFGVLAPTPTGERVVASCGLFRDGFGTSALGRFQHVSTHPAWQRRGLCRALVNAVCRHGFEAMALTRLVIVADPDDVAIALYESLGFERGVSTWNLLRPPARQFLPSVSMQPTPASPRDDPMPAPTVTA